MSAFPALALKPRAITIIGRGADALAMFGSPAIRVSCVSRQSRPLRLAMLARDSNCMRQAAPGCSVAT
jgi:hypothetical protein